MKKQHKKSGFTLVELLVVIAILAILATVSVVGYTAFIERAQKSNALSEAEQIREIFRAAVLSGDTYTLTASSETSAIIITSSNHETGALSSVTADTYLASTTTAFTINSASVTPVKCNADLADILTGGKYIKIAANATNSVTYHYVSGNYSYDVTISLTDFDADLSI